MTICAGFKSRYGVVLSTDTQETIGNTKINAPKLVIKPSVGDLNDKVRMLFAGAGDALFIDRLVEEMWKAAQVGPEFTMEAVFERVEDASIDWHTKIWQVYNAPDDWPQAQFLFAIYVPNEVRLYKSIGPVISAIENYAFIGCGNELAEFLAEHIRVEGDSVEEDVAMSLYVISNAKEYVPGCGRDTQIAALMLDGEIQTMQPYYARRLTEGIQEIAKSVFYLFTVACNPESSAGDIRGLARRTATNINGIRAKLDKEVPNRVRVSQELKDSVQVLYQRIEWPPTA